MQAYVCTRHTTDKKMEWITAFLLTLGIEIPVLILLLKEENLYKTISAGFLMNLISHPTLWFILPSVLPKEHYIMLGEMTVYAIEVILLLLFFRKEQKTKILLITFIVNSLSFLAGEFIYFL